MTAAAVHAFNTSLIASGTVLTIRPYIKKINEEIFKQPIEGFADDLLDLVTQDECCIPHHMLVKYGVLMEKNAGANVLRLLNQYEFIEGADFQSSTLKTGPHGGSAPKHYQLHPDAFEQCLMRAKNTRTYSRFYSLLRKGVTAYDKYQLIREQCKTAALVDKADRLTNVNGRLEQMLHDLGVKTDGVMTEIREVKTQNAVMTNKIDNLGHQNATLLAGVTELKRTADETAAIAHTSLALLEASAAHRVRDAADVALPPDDPVKSEVLVLLRLDAAKYHAVRTQEKFVAAGIREQRKTYPDAQEVLRMSGVPNSKHLWNRAKEVLGDRIRTMSPANTTFTLAPGTTEDDVVAAMRTLFDEPVAVAEGASTRAKAWAGARRLAVTTAETTAARTVAVVRTTTTTERTEVPLSGAEIDALLADYF